MPAISSTTVGIKIKQVIFLLQPAVTQASGITSTAFGNFAFATGDISFAAGNSVFAKAKMGTSLGTYNDITDSPNPSVESSGDRIFQVGNGSGNLSRSNALTILRNGNIGMAGDKSLSHFFLSSYIR
ncbi:MAG: hypothetical protein IPM04_13650 [Saprospiraceae bacterium]|nr:hypothetical protein [Candidatus Brachybacter algidus]MBK8748860.1 hypothetical protein [Candidatus Brachybacter algidus]